LLKYLLMTTIRAFIAINLSLAVQSQLDRIATQMKAEIGPGPVRWVAACNIHLTLKFLGDIPVSDLDNLKKILQSQASRIPAFGLSLGEVGAFPSFNRPRVIWVGVQAPVELSELQRGIDMATAALGYASEGRPFSPHLTLGRVSRNADASGMKKVSQALENRKFGVSADTRVEAVHLYQSDLKPEGAVYTCLYSAALVNANARP
jgi:2'-5' RNA ligase